MLTILYAPGLGAWFQQDDFAWLYMSRWMPADASLFYRLFSAQAQGTVRPLGDRLPFLLLMQLFGRNAFVFHAFAFAAQLVNAVLVTAIGMRLLSSPGQGAVVALLWSASASLVAPMVWASALNQTIFAFFLLSAFLCRLLYEETGRRKFLALEWTAFVLGFGAQEWNVVYPALVLAWMALSDRWAWKQVAMQFSFAGAYSVIHVLFVPSTTGPYTIRLSMDSLHVLWRYWSTALGPEELARRFGSELFLGAYSWVALLTALAVLSAVKCKSRTSVRVALFGLLWFVAAISPVLLIPNQVQGYYLFVPSIGIAILCGAAVSSAFAPSSGKLAKALAVLALSVFAGANLRTAVSERDWTIQRTLRVKHFYDSLAEARRTSVAPCLLLSGMSDDAFWAGYYGVRRYVPDLEDTYLAPGASRTITPALTIFGTPADYEMPEAEARASLASGHCSGFDVARNQRIAPQTNPAQR
ncbi:MAG: hypothetical protein ABL967_03540 [Bryobacteraceae bacterium]